MISRNKDLTISFHNDSNILTPIRLDSASKVLPQYQVRTIDFITKVQDQRSWHPDSLDNPPMDDPRHDAQLPNEAPTGHLLLSIQ